MYINKWRSYIGISDRWFIAVIIFGSDREIIDGQLRRKIIFAGRVIENVLLVTSRDIYLRIDVEYIFNIIINCLALLNLIGQLKDNCLNVVWSKTFRRD